VQQAAQYHILGIKVWGGFTSAWLITDNDANLCFTVLVIGSQTVIPSKLKS
jgi:hypothetical protein